MDFVPNFNPAKLLHGEQYLKIKGPIPTSGTLVNTVRLREVLDKGKAAAVTVIVDTKDKSTGESIFENQSTVFLRGSGGFGGKKDGAGKYMVAFPAAAADNKTEATRRPLTLHQRGSPTRLWRNRPRQSKLRSIDCQATTTRCTSTPAFRAWAALRSPVSTVCT